MNQESLVNAFVIKRKSFEYEKEIRALIYLPDNSLGEEQVLANESDNEKGNSESRRRIFNPKHLTDKGKYVSTDLDVLIESIYVAPYAESWFKDVVESLLSKYQVNKKVIKSDLYTLR